MKPTNPLRIISLSRSGEFAQGQQQISCRPPVPKLMSPRNVWVNLPAVALSLCLLFFCVHQPFDKWVLLYLFAQILQEDYHYAGTFLPPPIYTRVCTHSCCCCLSNWPRYNCTSRVPHLKATWSPQPCPSNPPPHPYLHTCPVPICGRPGRHTKTNRLPATPTNSSANIESQQSVQLISLVFTGKGSPICTWFSVNCSPITVQHIHQVPLQSVKENGVKFRTKVEMWHFNPLVLWKLTQSSHTQTHTLARNF